MTSLAPPLVVNGSVSVDHLCLRKDTGTSAWPLAPAVIINSVPFVVLLIDTIRTGLAATWITLLAALI